jgi:hypothetical protein
MNKRKHAYDDKKEEDPDKKRKTTTTTLVSLKVSQLRKTGYNNIKEWLEAADSKNVYIGRRERVFIHHNDIYAKEPPGSKSLQLGGVCYKKVAENPQQSCSQLATRSITEFAPGSYVSAKGTVVEFFRIHASKFQNPFTIKEEGGRQNCIDRFSDYLQKHEVDVTELCGKTLGCWCAPEPCHGDAILRKLR